MSVEKKIKQGRHECAGMKRTGRSGKKSLNQTTCQRRAKRRARRILDKFYGVE